MPFMAPTYSPECAFGAYHVAGEFLAPLVLHKDFRDAKEINDAMTVIKGNPFAHADVLDHARLQREPETPLCLDESISSPYMAEKALEVGACRIINIKPGRCGGLYNAKKINEMAASATPICRTLN